MRNRFDMQLEQLSALLIGMGGLCEKAITNATEALKNGDLAQAKLVIKEDEEIDQMEKEIESLCLKLLLQQQPVARDLRQISAALKMISDMERIGDQAFDIAEITASIKQEGRDVCSDHIRQMTEASIEMVTGSIESFVKKDMNLANDVIMKDDEVDDLFDEVKKDLINAVTDDETTGEYFVDILMIAKYLERICDHAVNIAEWVIFSITGQHVNDKHI